MTSSNYNPYNYQSYQQSSAPQYSAYQTAPAAANTLAAQAPRQQYQQAPPAVTTQAQDYLSYPAASYNNEANTYSSGQGSWTASNYGATRGETTRGAAEVLHSMSNTAYTPNTTTAAAGGQSGYTSTHAANASATRYSNASPAQHARSAHSSHTYGQAQARPPNVNTSRAQSSSSSRGLPLPATTATYPPQRAHNLHNQHQHQQRSASPAQPQYNNTTTPATSIRNPAVSATSQYNDHSHRQLPSVGDTSRNGYSYTENQATTVVPQTAAAASTDVNDQYNQNQSAITVDPMQVYDPWPEYQRKQEKLRQQKALEDAARAEEERKAEENRQQEEKKKEEERLRLEEEERSRQPKPQAQDAAGPEDALEAEIRAMMVKMRELNSKDPALLARIWEEERKAKAPKSPTVQNKTTPQPAAAPATAAPTAAPQPAQTNTASRRRTAPKAKASTPQASAATPVPTPKPPAAPRSSGQTIWPPEKKAHLAHAASTYLTAQNPEKPMSAEQFLGMLNGNPSYIELCEQLEGMEYKVDRGAFAKSLLTAVPDVNSTARPQANASRLAAPPTPIAPPAAIIVKDAATPVVASPSNGSSHLPSFENGVSADSPIPVAEMVPIKPELKPPANKEEAARKRTFNDLIDLTTMDEDEFEPLPKKQNAGAAFGSLGQSLDDAMDIDHGYTPTNNFPSNSFPLPATPAQISQQTPVPSPQLPSQPRFMHVVQPLDKKKALRRNAYNVKTIARDVLLACGRHPEERQLNAHLDLLKTSLAPQVTNDSDLSTLRWDHLDPGHPPRGYYRDGSHPLIDDADDEDESEDERNMPRSSSLAGAIGGPGGTDARVQALPATNPFKIKRRGRPPRNSYPDNSVTPRKPPVAHMSASAPRPVSANVGYSAFRAATEYGPDGQLLPKKKGRPVGWRKAIHGSPSAQARPAANGHTGRFVPSQPSALRKVNSRDDGLVMINSRSPSVSRPEYQSFKCRWQNCQAELHNLETLKKHVHKVHQKETLRGTLECLWDDCSRQDTNTDPVTGMRLDRHSPFVFTDEPKWREHIEIQHFSPLSWKQGDGPASGLSGNYCDIV
jgi:hypothetical protein